MDTRPILLFLFVLNFYACNTDKTVINKPIMLDQVCPSIFTYSNRKNVIVKQENILKRQFINRLFIKYKDSLNVNIFKSDTLILIQYYDNIYYNCNFERLALIVRDKLHTNQLNPVTFKEDFSSITTQKIVKIPNLPFNDAIYQLYSNKNSVNFYDPSLYGSPCFDGERGIITWLFPDKTCKQIFVNCIN